MKRIIATLCILMIAIIGVSAVAASADADNASTVELKDFANCTFKNCTTNETGGAIYPVKNIIRENCTFENNKQNDTGGATYIEEESNETRGTIYSRENITIMNSNITKEVEEKINAYDKIMDIIKEDKYSSLNLSEKLYFNKIYYGIIDSYDGGHSTKNIALEYYMTPLQVQNIVDTYYEPISDNPKVDRVYKMYGSHTLNEIANNLKITNEEAARIILDIKHGFYGKHFKKLFTKRDLVSMNDNHPEFVIGDII